ncbi:MAG: hypothetical protein KY461_12985 [Actinobacteria bacterium]|nr:hypothetical protein [Actinomycetota bacterium]
MATRRNRGDAPAPHVRRRRIGATLMAGSLAVGTVLATLAPAAAQEGPAVPEDAEKVEVEQSAYYAYPYNEVAPDTATAEFPPGVFCLVAPGAPVCQPNPVSEGVEGGLGAVEEGEPHSPQSPVPPDSLPASLVNGEKRYESAVKFTLPSFPAGQEISGFTLVLTERQPTYHSSSPAFRRAVLGALSCVRECDPAEEFQATLETEPVEQAVLEVEVCPLTAPFEPGPSQEPPAEQPVDCIYGANAQRVEGTEGTWLVDLTFTAQAWASGELDNHGILIRPSGAPNMAYGDPDPSTQAQVTFTQEILAASASQPAPEAPPAFDGGSFDSGSQGGGDFATDSGGFSSPSGGGGGFSSDPFSAPASGSVDEGAPPEVAPGETDEGGAAVPAGDTPVAGPATEPAATGSAWWLWLLVPIFAVGSWMTAQSLAAEPIVTTGAISRNGAMTRLIARNQAGTPSAPMTQV